MNSFIPWVGGKKALRGKIVSMFPDYYKNYIEVFGGAAWVLFYKDPRHDFEGYNDLNSCLVNLYRCVRDKPEELMDKLRYVLNSREDFDLARKRLADPNCGTDVQRAAWYYQVIRQSYGAATESFGARPQSIRSTFPLIEQAYLRLENVLVVNKDFSQIIRYYDHDDSLFYCDPPYVNAEGYYKGIGDEGFTEADHIRLHDDLMSTHSKFLLSYNDDEFVRRLYNDPGLYLTEVKRPDSLRQRTQPGAMYSELIISNYAPPPTQFSLFDYEMAS